MLYKLLFGTKSLTNKMEQRNIIVKYIMKNMKFEISIEYKI